MHGGSGLTPTGEPFDASRGVTVLSCVSNDAAVKLTKVPLSQIPGVRRYTDTANGSTVVTARLGSTTYRTWEQYADGGESEITFTDTWGPANVAHDTLVYLAGGRKGPAPA